MDTLIELLLASLFTCFFVGAIDAFITLRKTKGFVALIFSALVLFIMGYTYTELAIMAPAGAFMSLAIISLLERPTVVQPTRRY